MSSFHALTIGQLTKETEDCVSLAFDVPEDKKALFRYQPGQHITLRKVIEGADVRRSYSICTSPKERKLKVAIKKVAGGAFSTYANETLRAGDTLEAMPPSGSFHPKLSPRQTKSYVGFAAGSGITPILSILKSALDTELHSQFTLVYANKKAETIIFREEIEGLKNKYIERLSVFNVLSQAHQENPLFAGRMDEDKVMAFSKSLIDVAHTDEFFICGPEPMMLSVRSALLGINVSPACIHVELFTSPVGKLGGNEVRPSTPREKVKSSITVLQDGEQTRFDYNSEGTLLDVAAQQGLDMPYACKGGVCATCKAKLLAGKVDMEVNYALEPDEIEKGFILTCQSYPATAAVTLSFDEH